MPEPKPDDDLETKHESEFQRDTMQTVPKTFTTDALSIDKKGTPTRTRQLYPLSPSPAPTTVNLVDPVVGPLVVAAELTTALS
jgi:hypothetical protein